LREEGSFDIIEMFYDFDKTKSSIKELINW